MKTKNNIDNVAKYYSDRLSNYGPTPKGVDWNAHAGQISRFDQLIKILPSDISGVSIADLGCGYAALYSFLAELGVGYQYVGYDISESMCSEARNMVSTSKNAEIIQSSSISKPCHYAFASGVFNVKLDSQSDVWQHYILDTLNNMNEMSERGFSFNCLTKYSDPDKKVPHLYYADPLLMFDYCKRNFSRKVALLHDYELYEFTILVRK